MIEIKESDQALLVSLRVQPKASANRILGEHDGALKVSVTAAPEKGKANAGVITLLSKELGIPKSSIEIVRGDTSRIKTLRIRGTTKQALAALLKRPSESSQ